MNLETKITIYKFTPQVFTLTLKKFNKVKVSSCHWGYCVFFVYDARSR